MRRESACVGGPGTKRIEEACWFFARWPHSGELLVVDSGAFTLASSLLRSEVYGPYVVTLLDWTPMFEGLVVELRMNTVTTHVTMRLDIDTFLGSIVTKS